MADAIRAAPAAVPRPYLEFRPLLRALGIASDARKLILAGRSGLAGCSPPAGAAWTGFAGRPGSPVRAGSARARCSRRSAGSPSGPVRRQPVGDRAVPRRWSPRSSALFTPGSGPRRLVPVGLMAVWAAVAWGIFGGAIARIAVVQAGDRPQGRRRSALRFALGKSGSLIGAPLTPMLAVAIFAAGSAACSACSTGSLAGSGGRRRGPRVRPAAARPGDGPDPGRAWPLGWPLMHATVAAEGEDAADALSRSYSYVNQRLVRYAAHAVGRPGDRCGRPDRGRSPSPGSSSAWPIGASASGAPSPIASTTGAGAADSSGPGLVGLLVPAWAYSYFWSAASIIYLILRRDVNGTPWHEVYLPEHDPDTFAGEPSPAGPSPRPSPRPRPRSSRESAPGATAGP